MAASTLDELERQFFASLNAWAEPLARGGVLSPGPYMSGLVLIEVRGRISGEQHPVPLVGTRIGELLLVSTLRGNRSHWLRNLESDSAVRYWIHGVEAHGRAIVVNTRARASACDGESPEVRALAGFLAPATVAGWAFAIIVPTAAG